VLTSPSDVELEPDFITQPDVYVVPMTEWRRLENDDDNVIHALLLASEILSPSSARHDRVRKRPLYQRHVSDYWIVDLDARLIEHWVPDDIRPEVATDRLVWHPAGAATPFSLDIPEYFRRVLDS